MQRYLRKNSDCNLIPNSWYALRVIKLGADDLAYKLWKELVWASKIMQQWVLTIFAFIESLEYALWHSKLLKYFNCCSFKNLVWTWNQDFFQVSKCIAFLIYTERVMDYEKVNFVLLLVSLYFRQLYSTSFISDDLCFVFSQRIQVFAN